MDDESLRVAADRACEVIGPLVAVLGARLDLDPDANDQLAVRALTDFGLRIWAAAHHQGSVEAVARLIEGGVLAPDVRVDLKPPPVQPPGTLGDGIEID